LLVAKTIIASGFENIELDILFTQALPSAAVEACHVFVQASRVFYQPTVGHERVGHFPDIVVSI
jgi:hypothetical protein